MRVSAQNVRLDLFLKWLQLEIKLVFLNQQSGWSDETMNYQQALLEELRELPEASLPNLLQIVRLFKESLLIQSRQAALDLQLEFAQWDRLSDQALEEFEKELQ